MGAGKPKIKYYIALNIDINKYIEEWNGMN